jgi:divalent anion:Na+ symporter, DASS family
VFKWRWAITLLSGVAIVLLPIAGVAPAQKRLLAIFVATVVGLVTQPIAMGAVVLTAMTTLVLTNTLSSAAVLSGFGNATVWLIFTAFLFSRAVTTTKLGARVAYFFIGKFGRNALTLGYSVAFSDLMLAPFVPSDTARGGGIIAPITRSVSEALGSEPGPTANRMGSFLVLVAFHTTYVASAMFLTGMASNPLAAEFANKIAHVELTWLKWIGGAIVPGALSLLIVPYLIYRLHPPEIRDTEAARTHARAQLHEMGPISGRELRLSVIMLLVMTGWVTAPWHSIPNAFVALSGVCAILICRVLVWDELLAEGKAWDALIWFAPLIMMADELNRQGVMAAVTRSLFRFSAALPWGVAFAVLMLTYLYIHYGFASMTAQITALYPAFLSAALAGGVPPLMAAFGLAYFSNLNAGMTHYGTGSAPVYFGMGYVRQAMWWKLGFIISLVNVALWLGIGSLWWKLIGLW